MARYAPSALIWVILAPLFYSAMSASAKLAGTHLSVWQIGAGRFGLGLLVAPVIVKVLGLNLWGQQRFLLTLRGLCGAVAFLLLLAAFQRIPLSLAMVLFYLYPAFTALLSPWLTGEPTPKIAWPFICSAFVGTSLILWPHEASGALNLGHLFAVIASILCALTLILVRRLGRDNNIYTLFFYPILCALTLILVRRLGRDNNIYTLFFYLCLAGTVASLGPWLIQEAPLLPERVSSWIGLAAVAVFSIGAQLSINQALVRIPAPAVSVMMTAEVPLVAGFGVLYLGEPFDWRLICGALLIFCSGIGLNLLPIRGGNRG
jgi:drug/metabolite transporter (DMT)-like permease